MQELVIGLLLFEQENNSHLESLRRFPSHPAKEDNVLSRSKLHIRAGKSCVIEQPVDNTSPRDVENNQIRDSSEWPDRNYNCLLKYKEDQTFKQLIKNC